MCRPTQIKYVNNIKQLCYLTNYDTVNTYNRDESGHVRLGMNGRMHVRREIRNRKKMCACSNKAESG